MSVKLEQVTRRQRAAIDRLKMRSSFIKVPDTENIGMNIILLCIMSYIHASVSQPVPRKIIASPASEMSKGSGCIRVSRIIDYSKCITVQFERLYSNASRIGVGGRGRSCRVCARLCLYIIGIYSYI